MRGSYRIIRLGEGKVAGRPCFPYETQAIAETAYRNLTNGYYTLDQFLSTGEAFMDSTNCWAVVYDEEPEFNEWGEVAP